MSAGGLPAEVTPFFGRRHELAEAKRVLGMSRLLTITGMGGIGKTRLALRLAHDLRGSFRDGVFLVPLAALTTAELLARTVADVLGVHNHSPRPALDALVEFLRDKRLLLVLDNCEHLVDQVGSLVATLLVQAPHLHVVATSRIELGVPGEHPLTVPPLSLPGDPENDASDLLSDGRPSDALRLLEARGAAVGFRLTPANAADAARLCRRLDGIPLAIELAAVRLRSLSLREVLDRLSTRFDTLTGSGSSSIPDRHQTLRAAVDWSYDLCCSEQKLIWNSVAVFSGGFDLDSATAVCASEELPADRIVDLIDKLVRQSILTVDTSGVRARYHLVETLREYGRDRLKVEGKVDALRRRHRDYFTQLAQTAADTWFGPRELELLNQLRTELPNLRDALSYGLATAGEEPAALDLAVNLVRTRFWIFFATIGEGRMWLKRTAMIPGQPRLPRLTALAMAAWLALCQGDLASAAQLRDLYLALAATVDLPPPVRAAIAFAEGCYTWLIDTDPEAVTILLGARDLFRSVGADGDASMAELFATMAAGFLADADTAVRHARAFRDMSIASRSPWPISWSHFSYGLALLSKGDLHEALHHFRLSLVQQQAMRDRWGPAWGVEAIAWTAARLGQFQYAVRVLGAADEMRRTTGADLPGLLPFAQARADADARARRALTPTDYVKAYDQGSSLTFWEAVDIARNPPRPASDASPRPQGSAVAPAGLLSKREHEIIGLVAEGLSDAVIAERLVISVRTVSTHVSSVLRKLGLSNRREIMAWVRSADSGNGTRER